MEPDLRKLGTFGGIFTVLSLTVTLGGLAAVSAAGDPPAKPKTQKPVATKKTTAQPKTATTAPASAIVNDNTPLTEEQKIVHVLNRLGFGPRPGDVEKIKAMGLNKYIEQQLNPNTIADTVVNDKLATFTILQKPNTELGQMYAMRQSKLIKTAKARQKVEEKGVSPEMMQDTTMAPAEKLAKVRNAYQDLTPEEREALKEFREAQQTIRQGGVQLALDKTIRAVESEKQLQEVLVDFWSNHFNIDMRKNACAVYKISDERDVIRKNLFGNFREILGASAKSPAMLVYLDNAQSQAPKSLSPREQRRLEMVRQRAEMGGEQAKLLLTRMQGQSKRGINENYAREIMELHTLGVDGGYTQKDVQEVARCLTGWTINRLNGEFRFDRNRHDEGEKIVLGQMIPANGGMQDGETVLDKLAMHPSTMRFISTKLCRRFVADEPPKSLVDKCVATWKRTNGNLREVYRTIFTSPEFYSRAAYRQKLKSPFEFAVSSVRALDGTFNLAGATDRSARIAFNLGGKGQGGYQQNRTVAGQVGIMGQPLYQYQAPTGYPEDSRKWVSSGALISRLNYALFLAGGRMMDVNIQKPELTGSSTEQVNTLIDHLLQGEVSPSTRATLLKQATTTPTDAQVAETDPSARLVALVLGSPEFQRR